MKIRSRWLNLVLSWTATCGLRLLFLFVKVEHYCVASEGTPYVKPRGKQRFTFSMWHDHIALAAFSLKTYSLAGLISQHRDGGYLADSVMMAGIRPVRGSTSRGGLEAVREILSLPELHLAITPDGPRGPRHQMKEGVIYISSRSGRPVVPCALQADRFWSIGGGWTDMIIPKPFSRVVLIAGTPLVVPEETPREDLGAWAELLQSEMSRLESIGQQILAGDRSAVNAIDRTNDPAYTPHPSQSDRIKAA
ncbi:MAG: lysophospholipid acyltransferase family protein [Planctomycetaceae bacterium]